MTLNTDDYQFVVPVEIHDERLYPSYAHEDDAGADLRASTYMTVPARGTALVPTGVKLSIPSGYVGLVHPRSGLALKHQITVLNSPGTIDAGYLGEIKVILINHSDVDFKLEKYDRIAQIVFQPVVRASLVDTFIPFSELGHRASRGAGGFGSTGTN